MKRFVIKTICFLIPILAAAFSLEILLRDIPNNYSLKKEYLDKNSFEIETLILGSSHSFYGLDPEYFSDKTFNASHVSQSLRYDYEILKKYQEDFSKLDTIILPISYFSFPYKVETSQESWRVKNYVLYYGLGSSTALVDHSEVLSNKMSANAERLFFNYMLGSSNVTCTELGWGETYSSKNALDLVETGKATAEIHTRDDIHTDKYEAEWEENVLILNSIMQWSKERNVKVLLLTFPAYETYVKNLNSKQLTATIKTTNKICSKYDNCTYDNLLVDTRFVAEDFYDADHMSEIGAKKLSELINRKIIKWK